MRTTKIEWTERTWNPITGCSKISEGCEHCYAERMAKRLAGRAGYDKDNPFRVTIHGKRHHDPEKWRDPSMIFVCSMGDLFHKDVPTGDIWDTLCVMRDLPRHTFQVLTKRPERFFDLQKRTSFFSFPPAKNIWFGVTAENRARADERIPTLLQIPAAVRFVSVEPMLGPVDIGKWLYGYHQTHRDGTQQYPSGHIPLPLSGCKTIHSHPPLDWVICGPETGPGARKMEIQWARDLRDQCEAAGVPFFFKKGKLDGKEYHNYPAVRGGEINAG